MLYVIGDIHGCLEPLRRLMAQLHPSEVDEVVFLGDYVDRGPDSKGVIDYLLTLQGRCVFLMGNHERMFLDFLRGRQRLPFLYNGGTATVESYGELNRIPTAHLAFLDRLKLYYETQDYLFVHAGIRPGISLQKQDKSDLLWIRGDFYAYPGRYHKTIVFGHTSMREVLMEDDRIGIDTACVYGNKLTCLILPSRDVIQVCAENHPHGSPHAAGSRVARVPCRRKSWMTRCLTHSVWRRSKVFTGKTMLF